MSGTFRHPMRALVRHMQDGDTIRIDNGPEMTKAEALACIREQEKQLNAFFGGRNKKARRANAGQHTQPTREVKDAEQ